MTIKEFYEWACENGIEDYQVKVDVGWDAYFIETEDVHVDDLASNVYL